MTSVSTICCSLPTITQLHIPNESPFLDTGYRNDGLSSFLDLPNAAFSVNHSAPFPDPFSAEFCPAFSYNQGTIQTSDYLASSFDTYTGLEFDVQRASLPIEASLYPQVLHSTPLSWEQPSEFEPVPSPEVSVSGIIGIPTITACAIVHASNHESPVESKARIALPSQPHRFRCSRCVQRFQFAQELSRHEKYGHSDYRCYKGKCKGKPFTSQRALTRHQQTSSAHASRKYRCICGSESTRRDHHLAHLRSCALMEARRFHCVCGQVHDSARAHRGHLTHCNGLVIDVEM
ncbi:hypothetical protein HD806DRAFT_523162 [Xylariaceae sp. AK1471]|nr:hypothetical protein HD806DRAFT_523162 [Xylariaceae sp. AK1471]